MLQILFSLDLIKFSKASQKMLQDRQVRLLGSSLFHSLITNDKKVLGIFGPKVKRSKCICLSSNSADRWNKAMNIFCDLVMKNLIK